jgi:hypothetical protein
MRTILLSQLFLLIGTKDAGMTDAETKDQDDATILVKGHRGMTVDIR